MREGGGRTIDERVRKVFISILRNRCEVNGGYSDAQCHFDDDDLACIQREFGMTKSRARGVLSRFRNSFDVHERRDALAQGLWCRPREVEEDAKAKGRTTRVVWEHQPVLAKALLEQCKVCSRLPESSILCDTTATPRICAIAPLSAAHCVTFCGTTP